MNKNLQVAKYVLSDSVAAAASWFLFYSYRKVSIESVKYGIHVPVLLDHKFWEGLVGITIFWICFYALTGTYRNIYRKSRLKEFGTTMLHSLIGVLVIFFVLLLDDTVISYRTYYMTTLVLLGTHFLFTATGRLILSSITNSRIRNRRYGFSTILIGSNANALKLYSELENQKKSWGNKFLGFVHVDQKNGYSKELKEQIPHLGEVESLNRIIQQNKAEEVIIAIESSEHDRLNNIINMVTNTNVLIKIVPDMYDILSGQVKMSSIYGAPLIEVNREIMPAWQQSLKRAIDICASLFALTILSPVYIFVACAVKFSSRGPIFYSHERIGLHGKPFMIHKFRSMVMDAEKNGPALSSKFDPRITPFGRFMRKTRLDELPQFYNVLIGEMSIVGPRPERQFFIDQLIKVAPHYRHLHKVKPGITSWGQVKYGYAENVEQMIERLKYDLLYIENMSLYVDFKIMIYTVLIVFQGRGK
ncbi:MAG TPA: sugar transferase [Bacteroidia bacterium]|jgi:exopolysaccharide biosynthesis polyprenyl glycosylphosphotransferase|nr:sugar transferase [Bacteroidia bacterium]